MNTVGLLHPQIPQTTDQKYYLNTVENTGWTHGCKTQGYEGHTVHLLKKHPCISGPVQFKLLLSGGQLYFKYTSQVFFRKTKKKISSLYDIIWCKTVLHLNISSFPKGAVPRTGHKWTTSFFILDCIFVNKDWNCTLGTVILIINQVKINIYLKRFGFFHS